MSEKFEDNKAAIKSLLKQGKLVVSNRATGKTAALVEIFHEDPRAVIVLPTEAGKQHFARSYAAAYGKQPDRTRLLMGTQTLNGRHPDVLDPIRNNVYVDEYYINEYKGPFYAAVTSFPIPVVVL